MKKIINLFFILIFIVILAGCTNKNQKVEKNGVYYEIFVRSFADSNDDGIGDINGVTEKLDYLEDLGVQGIWLMPINPTDSYHGYDVKDYYAINSEYGTMDDFERLIKEAHKRDIKVIMDLVINHSSKNNEWFIKSKNEDEKYRDYYTWVDENSNIKNAKKTENNNDNLFHKVDDKYYYGYFSDTMPDLNLANEAVKEKVFNVGKFWLEKGVDGFRLDAALHIYSEYENTQKTFLHNIYFWKEFREEMRKVNKDVYLVGEVYSDIVTYSQFYQGLDSTFNFDISSLIINAVSSNGANYANIVKRQYDTLAKYDPDFIDAPFLSNHDLDRVASQLSQKGQNDIDGLKLAAETYLILPGHPFIYYGEEIGMKGVKSSGPYYDETRRLPFIWGDEYTTSWFEDEYNQDLISAVEQINDTNSLYNIYKTMIQLRMKNIALSNGDFIPYQNKNYLLQGYYRVYNEGNEKQLVVVFHNFSNKSQELPVFEDGSLLYQSHGKNGYENNQIEGLSTVIIELPYKDMSKYITE